jgi:hypothetical protein
MSHKNKFLPESQEFGFISKREIQGSRVKKAGKHLSACH